MYLRMTLVLASLCLYASAACAERSPEQKKAIDNVRAVLAARELDQFDPAIGNAKKLKGDVSYQEEVNRLELLGKYVQEFWKAVDNGAKSSIDMGELKVGDVIIAVVDYDRRFFVIRHEGQNKRYTIDTIPAKLALVVAQVQLDASSAANKVYFGAFLAMDGHGDRTLAKRYWDEAAKSGVDVKFLLPELDVPKAKPPIELPQPTAASKLALNPAQWQVRKKVRKRYELDPLTKIAKLSDEGRLEVPAIDGEEVAIVNKNRVGGDFSATLYLVGVAKDQKFGVFPTSPSDSPVLVDLPEGTAKVELQRRKGVYYCKINDGPIEIPPGDGSGKLAGYLGFTHAGPMKIASFELSGK